MVKLDICGGLLGTGKTTLIRQMLATAYAGHKTAVIENEIGKVNLDAELSVSANEGSGAVRMRSRGKQPLSTWCFTFEQKFSEEDIRCLLEIFRQEEADGIWRVKGYLKMADGRIRKVDVVFGDQFQEELEGFDDDKVNQLVIIGKKLNMPWLRKQMGIFFK